MIEKGLVLSASVIVGTRCVPNYIGIVAKGSVPLPQPSNEQDLILTTYKI